jgi:general secretion pathway protein F
MPQFRYLALDSTGKRAKGAIDADDLRQARLELQSRGLTPLTLTASAHWLAGLKKTGEPNGRELALLTRQLATLVGASLPLEEALSALARQCEKKSHATLIQNVRSRVLEGLSLAEALNAWPKTFNTLFRAMVAAGETSGYLAPVLARLADHSEQSQKIKSRLMQAMIYPIVLTCVALGVITVLLTAVVPQVVEQFVHMHQSLPFSTRLLIKSSEIVRTFGPGVALVLLISIMIFHYWLRQPANRMIWHRLYLRMPIVGKVTRGNNLARYAQTLSILSASGVPLLDGMNISGTVVTNVYIRQLLLDAAGKVSEGGSISQALEQTKIFPPMMHHMIASGEQSGELEKMLSHTAELQEQMFLNQINIALGLFEPLLIISMAGVVMFIVIAILQPLLQLNSILG